MYPKHIRINTYSNIPDDEKYTITNRDPLKKIDFTFGIITDGNFDNNIKNIIRSIELNNISFYEIIIIGNSKIQSTDKITVIPFDETQKKGWITRKKNIIVKMAKYDNIVLLHDYIVLLHDYIVLDINWYNGFLFYGDNFNWCVTRIVNINNTRFRDYALFPGDDIVKSPGRDIDSYFDKHCLLPYDFINTIKTNKYMYVSGAYYIIKKNIAETHLLDENLCHCESEDIEYSQRLHNNGIFIQCNPYSKVNFIKQKNYMLFENLIDEVHLKKYIDYCNSS